MMYVCPLPEVPRADPVGVAIAPDAVLVFHDGDTFTVLPVLSSSPTAPSAPRAPSQNPTPQAFEIAPEALVQRLLYRRA
jgi:hypothetical protein